MLHRLAQLWNKVWFEPLDPRPLALLRIAFGIYLLGYFLAYASSVELSFSKHGVYSPYLIPDIAPSPFYAAIIYDLTLAAIVSLILGFHTRVSAALVFLLFEYHFCLNFAVNNTAYDRLNTIILVVLCLADSGAAWSFDARKQTSARLIPAWQIRLLQFQLAALYFGSGLWKALTPMWHSGEMLKYTLAGPWGSPMALKILSLDLPDWVFTGLTWGVIAFELVAGFGLYFRKTKPFVMLVGATFHLCNVFVLVIPGFLNCIALYALFMKFGKRPAVDGDIGELQPAVSQTYQGQERV